MAIKEYKRGAAFPGQIGRTVSDSLPAWPDAPFRFTGTIHNVTMGVSGELIKDEAAEMRILMARQ